MYAKELIDKLSDYESRSGMMTIAKTKILKSEVESATDWMNVFYKNIPLKIRCYVIRNNITFENVPKCPMCGNPSAYDKEWNNSFRTYCSDKCSKQRERLSDYARECLTSYDCLYQKRIVEKISYDNIGSILGCSETPVIRAIKEFNVTDISLRGKSDKATEYQKSRVENNRNKINAIKLEEVLRRNK